MPKRYHHPLLVGLTGGIGSGQSTVARMLAKRGCKVIHADEKAKQVLLKSKKIKTLVCKTFGRDILDEKGEIDTSKLAEVAFKDELHTQKLNQIVHPRMVTILVEEMESARFSGRYPLVIIDAALIYEISIEQLFDVIVVVYAPIEERFKRVQKRDGLTRRQFMARVERQIPLEEKKKWADIVIDNRGSLKDLQNQVQAAYNKLMRLQARKEQKPDRPVCVS